MLLRAHIELADQRSGSELRYSASAGVRIADRRLLVGGELFCALPAERDTAVGTPREIDVAARHAINPTTRIGDRTRLHQRDRFTGFAGDGESRVVAE